MCGLPIRVTKLASNVADVQCGLCVCVNDDLTLNSLGQEQVRCSDTHTDSPATVVLVGVLGFLEVGDCLRVCTVQYETCV